MSSIFGYTIAFILFSYGFFLKKNRQNWFSPDVFYCFLWGTICFLTSLGLYGMKEIHTQCWFIILLGSFSFILGTHLSDYISVNNQKQTQGKFNEKIFFALLGLIIVLKIPDLILSIKLQMSGVDLYQIREASYGLTELEGYKKNSTIDFAVSLIMTPLADIMTAATINRFFLSSGKYRFIVPIFIIVVVEALSTGSRFVIAYFIIELLACFFLFKIKLPQKRMPKNVIFIVKIFTIIPFALIFFVTLLRASVGANVSFVKTFYFYLCGCVPFFDILLSSVEPMDYYTMSFFALFGFWSRFMPFIHYIGHFDYPDIYTNSYKIVLDLQYNYGLIADNYLHNAFSTPFYALYYDLRYTGVIIGMVIFGFSIQYLYKKSISSYSPLSTTTFLIFMHFLFKSLHQYPSTSAAFVTSVIMLVVIKFFKIPIV